MAAPTPRATSHADFIAVRPKATSTWATIDLDRAYEGRADLRRRDADLREPADAERLGKNKFLNAFREEHGAHEHVRGGAASVGD